MQRKQGFTLIELLVVISIIALLIGILLPALGAARRTARQMTNSTQLRGIQQGFVVFSQSNKKGGGDGFFPGLNSSGDWAGTEEASTADSTYGGDADNALDGTPAATIALMLNANQFTPEYCINPADTGASEVDTDNFEVSISNFSYAMLALDIANTNSPDGTGGGDSSTNPADARDSEWKETLNTSAIVMSDMNTGGLTSASGTNPGDDISSVWTEDDAGDWRGTVVKNDNSTSFETSPIFEQTKYGNSQAQDADHLFIDEATNTTAGSIATEFANATMVLADDIGTQELENQNDQR